MLKILEQSMEKKKRLSIDQCELNPMYFLDIQGMPGEKGEKGETGLPGLQVLFLFFLVYCS